MLYRGRPIGQGRPGMRAHPNPTRSSGSTSAGASVQGHRHQREAPPAGTREATRTIEAPSRQARPQAHARRATRVRPAPTPQGAQGIDHGHACSRPTPLSALPWRGRAAQVRGAIQRLLHGGGTTTTDGTRAATGSYSGKPCCHHADCVVYATRPMTLHVDPHLFCHRPKCTLLGA